MKRIVMIYVIILMTFSAYSYAQEVTGMTGSAENMNMPTAKITQMIINRENAIMNAVKNKDVLQFKDYLADDYIGVYDMGTVTKDQEVQSLNDFELKDFSMTDQKVTFPTKDIAIITYKATASGTDKGKEFSGTYNVTSTWVNRDGKWLGVEHAEVKVPSDQMK